MKNLAGNEDCDVYIREELEKAGITPFEILKGKSEVPYSVIGLLGHEDFDDQTVDFFKRNTCSIDLASFHFRRNWYYWSVRGYVPLDVAEIIYANPNGVTDIRAAGHCACPHPDEQVDSILVCGYQVVSSYDIDTQEGLNYFVQVLKEHGLV